MPPDFTQPTLKVAQELLGCMLVRKAGESTITAKIIETEAYCGEKDLACHASKGRTKRTEVLYQKAGTIYVYLCYGIHYLLNIVTTEEGSPEAVLVRGIEINGQKIYGPGRVTKALLIDKTLNNLMLGKKNGLYVSKNLKSKTIKFIKTPRIGIDYAGPIWSKKLYRFILED